MKRSNLWFACSAIFFLNTVAPVIDANAQDLTDSPVAATGALTQGTQSSTQQLYQTGVLTPPRWDDGVTALTAGPGVTALSGRVVTLQGAGLPNVAVSDGSAAVMTDADGQYLLPNIPDGRSVLVIDAQKAGAAEVTDYGYYQANVIAQKGVTTVLPYKSWLPQVDHAHDVVITSPTTAETVISTPTVPGVELHIPAGVIITGPDHKPVTKISITPIPSDRTPVPLPNNVVVPQYFTIQPGGSTITGVDGKWVGAQLWYPNYTHEIPGARSTFWRYDAYGFGWTTYGTGTVALDGQHFVPDKGTELYEFSGAMFNNPSYTPPGSGPKPGAGGPDPGPCPNCTCGDPVDPGTGLWTETAVDLSVADLTPLSVIRTYRQEDANRRVFGVGMTLSYDLYLYSSDPPNTYQTVDLITPAGGRVHFVRTSAGTDSTTAVMRSDDPGQFKGAIISWNGAGWTLTTTDGSLYVFGENAPLQYFQDRFGNRVTLTRDTTLGTHITSISSSNGRWIKFDYNDLSEITQATDNTGRTVTYGYTGDFLHTVTDPNGGVTTYNWDISVPDHPLLTSIQLPSQSPSGPPPTGSYAVKTAYDPSTRRVTLQTMQQGKVTYGFAYTLSGATVSATTITMTDANYSPARTTTCKLAFNSSGYWTSNKQAFGSSIEQDYTAVRGGDPIPPACNLNNASNSPAGALIALTDALGRTTCWTYNSAGKVLTETRLAGVTGSSVTTTYTYGAFDQLASITDPLSHKTTIALDSLGRVTSITDALTHKWTLTNNTNGTVAKITDPLGATHATTFTYDHGDLVKVTDALGHAKSLYTDALGRTTRIVDPQADVQQWSYDPIWGVHIATDANGNAVTTNYNTDGLVSNVVDPRSSTFKTQYAYDVNGRLTTRTDPLGHNDTINTFDGYNNPRTKTDRNSQNATYTYDLLGRVATATLADGHSLVYTWDAGNRLTRVDDTLAGATNSVIRGYDDLDRLMSEQVIQGATTIGTVSYTYDTASRRASMSVPGQTQLCYYFDDANRLITITRASPCAAPPILCSDPSVQECFTYFDNNLRKTVRLPNGLVGTYAYDNANELLTITYANTGGTTIGDLSYTYDSAGRVSSRGGSLFKSVLPTATTATAAYNQDNQLTSWNGAAASYDLNGNLTGDGTHTYTWDARNRMTAIKNNAGTSTLASLVYDGVGRRQSVTQSSATVTALYDGYDTVQEQGSTTANLQIGLGIDERFTRTKGGATSTYLTDQLGSTVALANSTGAVATTYSYDPYGLTTTVGAANDNQYQFTGRQNDGFGLYYFRARYYSPAWGRFVSEDKLGLAAGINVYAYVGGNPITHRDPSGRDVDIMGNFYGPPDPCYAGPSTDPYLTPAAIMLAGVAAPLALELGGSGLALGGAEAAGPELIGSFDVPAGLRFGTTTFGNYAHEAVANVLRGLYPEANFVMRVLPGQTGVDVEVASESVADVGFKYGEIKPLTASGEAALLRQVARWALSTPVQAITYDAVGNIFLGFR